MEQVMKDLQFVLQTPVTNVGEKSSVRAQKFRQDGNQLYSTCRDKKDYEKTYAYYAQSIAHAPFNSRDMALAYSNLSAVLLRLKQYSECLQAIDFCFNSGYPEQSKFKIYLRRIECLKVLDESLKAKKAYEETIVWIEKNQPAEEQKVKLKNELEVCYKKQVEVKKRFSDEEFDQIWQEFSIKKFNEEIPGASSAISLKYNESLGRHYVATRDIRPGEILLMERPFAFVCSKSSRYNCCWECFQSLKNCIPCDCCNNVIFCSVKCKEEAWKMYHQIESKVLHAFFTEKSKGYVADDVVMAVRIFIRAIKEYGTFEKLKNAELNSLSSAPRTRGFTNGQLLNDKYRAFCSLKGNTDNSAFFNILSAFVVVYIAEGITLLSEKFKACSQDYADLIANNLAIISRNCLNTTTFGDSNYPGKSLFIWGSFFNHSCVANACLTVNKFNTKSLAILPIKKGEQICIDYLRDSPYTREERQKIFETSFFFTCKCVACKNGWPHPDQFPVLKDSKLRSKVSAFCSTLDPFFRGTIDIKYQKDKEFLKTSLNKLSSLLEELVAEVPQPCRDIWLLQIGLTELFNQMRVQYM